MFMKKKLIVLLIIVLLVVTPIIVYFLTRGGGSDIAEGKYVIVNDTKFPDAYAVVKGKTIQFFNIDLNAYYQETMIEAYRRVEKSRTEPYTPMSDGELFRLTDLNSDFVDNAISFQILRRIKSERTNITMISYMHRSESSSAMTVHEKPLRRCTMGLTFSFKSRSKQQRRGIGK